MWTSLASNLRDAFRRPEEPLHLESRPAENDLIIREEGTFASLWSSVRDVFFPAKLPPLVLESKPIAVVDRMKVKRDPVSTAIAVVVHGLIILLIAFLLAKKIQFSAPVKTVELTDVTVPPMAPLKEQAMGG
jgi:protein TonB